MKRFGNLERTPWKLATGALADSDISHGNIPVAAQTQPLIECASFGIAPKGQSFANAYWYKELGADARKTHFVYEVAFLFPTIADTQACQALELDLQQTVSGVTFNWGLQFDFADNQVRVWDRGQKKWEPTGMNCPRWPAMAWMDVSLRGHRDSNKLFYDLLTINDSDHLLQSFFTQTRVGEKEQINCAVQLDGNTKGEAYRVMVDAVSLAAS